VLAQALASTFGRERLNPRLEQLCSEAQLRRAHCWGVAMRLGQRLSGGVGAILKRTSLSVSNGAIQLHTRRGEEALVGDQVERRLLRLAEAFGRAPAIVSG
jgi:exopolyphosphatase/guanosine-5'-triphosphate,3'-diphosphate pyrophosphatase